jgi:hypothetical protein
MKDKMFAGYLSDIYNAVSITGNWDSIRNFKGDSFMYANITIHPFLHDIQANMKFLDEHSGSSYGVCMRAIESIAKNGWSDFFQKYSETV